MGGESSRIRIATRFISSAEPASITPAGFRDIAAAISKLSARTLVLDGEVAIYDQQLRSRFDWRRGPDMAAVASGWAAATAAPPLPRPASAPLTW
jgi:hypothetical protein